MSKYLKAGFALVAMAIVVSSLALADDAPTVAPNNYKVALENERVRVLDVTVKPGETIPFHSHPDYSVYIVEGGNARFFNAPGDTGVAVEMKAGVAMWHDAETHSVKNTGKTNVHVVVTELKEPKPAAKPAAK
jgi:quercetin dioxygenase-like cupin family protein